MTLICMIYKYFPSFFMLPSHAVDCVTQKCSLKQLKGNPVVEIFMDREGEPLPWQANENLRY